MKASHVAYDFEELHKKLELKIIKSEYVRGCPKWKSTQIWLFKILGINGCFQDTGTPTMQTQIDNSHIFEL